MLSNEHYKWMDNSVCKKYLYAEVKEAKNYIYKNLKRLKEFKGKDIKLFDLRTIKNETKLHNSSFRILIVIVYENKITDVKYAVDSLFSK